MRRRGRVGALAAIVAAATLPGCGGGRPDAERASAPEVGTSARFLADYVAADGRVVRRDQGGDTVSEGQAYGLLLALADGDEATFTRVWGWTQAHLQRPDGLLSTSWRDGAVSDPQPAADADLDAAHALVVAADRFDRAPLRAAGDRLAAAILAHETLGTRAGPVLAAGPWAVRERIVNPSYFSPAAFRALARSTGDARWRELERTGYRVVDALTAGGAAPPNWAVVDRAGHAAPRADIGTGEATFGFDALRVPLRIGGARDRYGVGLAARTWHLFAPQAPGRIGVSYALDGTPRTAAQHPAMLSAAAAAAAAAGQARRATELWDRAVALQRTRPTYYGAAWLALSRLGPGRGATAQEAAAAP